MQTSLESSKKWQKKSQEIGLRNRERLKVLNIKVWIFWEGHKIWKTLPLKIWRYSVASNFKWKSFSNSVAFSEYPNFTKLVLNDPFNHLGDQFGNIQNLQTSPIPQTSFLFRTFFVVLYSKTSLVQSFRMFQKYLIYAIVRLISSVIQF